MDWWRTNEGGEKNEINLALKLNLMKLNVVLMLSIIYVWNNIPSEYFVVADCAYKIENPPEHNKIIRVHSHCSPSSSPHKNDVPLALCAVSMRSHQASQHISNSFEYRPLSPRVLVKKKKKCHQIKTKSLSCFLFISFFNYFFLSLTT